MLSRSSLETQKLELMSAMSELKLHQATLERENFELRSSHLNNNNNNNNISNDRRLPPVPANRIRTNSTSGSMVIVTLAYKLLDLQNEMTVDFNLFFFFNLDAAIHISSPNGCAVQQLATSWRTHDINTNSFGQQYAQ